MEFSVTSGMQMRGRSLKLSSKFWFVDEFVESVED